MNDKFNLYEDDVRKDSTISTETFGNVDSSAKFLYLDFTKELPELIRMMREELEDKPQGYSLNIYIVCGLNNNVDLELFIEYLTGLNSVFNLNYFIRGIIHPSFIEILTFKNVFVHENVKLFYNNNLHQLLKNLRMDRNIFQNFVRRFHEKYYLEPVMKLDLTELETIGFTINKFN